MIAGDICWVTAPKCAVGKKCSGRMKGRGWEGGGRVFHTSTAITTDSDRDRFQHIEWYYLGRDSKKGAGGDGVCRC